MKGERRGSDKGPVRGEGPKGTPLTHQRHMGEGLDGQASPHPGSTGAGPPRQPPTHAHYQHGEKSPMHLKNITGTTRGGALQAVGADALPYKDGQSHTPQKISPYPGLGTMVPPR